MAGGPVCRGYSLVELVAALAVVGVMAAIALPRLSDTRAYDEIGFYEATRAVLRYAQKSAIAKRRLVCVTFPSANSVTVTFAAAFGATACDTNLIGPGGENPYTITAASAVNFTPAPVNFTFNALGQPSAGQVISIAGSVRGIVVNADTGYVE